MFHLANDDEIQESKGIGLIKKTFYLYCFIGIIISISIVLFANPAFKDSSLVNRFITLAIFENFVLLMVYFIQLNFLPTWFKNIGHIKTLYYTKYFVKDYETLPHKEFNERASQSIIMTSIIDQIKEDTHIVSAHKINLNKEENKPIINNKDIGVIVKNIIEENNLSTNDQFSALLTPDRFSYGRNNYAHEFKE